jgi:hypothetical protein
MPFDRMWLFLSGTGFSSRGFIILTACGTRLASGAANLLGLTG